MYSGQCPLLHPSHSVSPQCAEPRSSVGRTAHASPRPGSVTGSLTVLMAVMRNSARKVGRGLQRMQENTPGGAVMQNIFREVPSCPDTHCFTLYPRPCWPPILLHFPLLFHSSIHSSIHPSFPSSIHHSSTHPSSIHPPTHRSTSVHPSFGLPDQMINIVVHSLIHSLPYPTTYPYPQTHPSTHLRLYPVSCVSTAPSIYPSTALKSPACLYSPY